MKKLWVLILAVSMCVAPCTVFAEETEEAYGYFTEDSIASGGSTQSGAASMLQNAEYGYYSEVNEAATMQEESQSEKAGSLGYTNCLIPDADFIGSVHYYEDNISIPFTLYQFGGSGETYYIYIKDYSGNIVADYSGTYGTRIDAIEKDLIWSGPHTTGSYFLGFYSTYPDPNGLDEYVYSFHVVEKPEVTTNVKAASAGGNTVKITWDETFGAEGYLVYAQKNGNYGYVGMTSGISYTDKNALSTNYNFYWVFPYIKDNAGKMHTNGCQKYAYAKGICAAPTNFKASSVNGGVKLTWNASEGAKGYLVYGIVNNGTYGYVGMTSGRTLTDKKASKNVWNFYWVFPYHMENGKMVTGNTPKYVWGKAK